MSSPVVHFLVAETAKAMAAEVYDKCASESDEFYKHNKSQKRWIEKNWGMFIVTARENLAGLLVTSMPEKDKEQIYDALLADASLPNVDLKNQLRLN